MGICFGSAFGHNILLELYSIGVTHKSLELLQETMQVYHLLGSMHVALGKPICEHFSPANLLP